MRRDLRFEAFYDVPVAEVWRALTDAKALSEWLMPNDFEPTVGHQFRFRDKPQGGWDGIVHCEVTEIIPEQRLSYTWKSDALDTTVTWSLQGHGADTRLVLEHKGFRGLSALMISMMLSRGWRGTLLGKKLPAFLKARQVRIK
jgi:uncharacterized protein YndB with AHSA1/START domain